MDAIGEVVLRNRERIGNGPVLLVDPPRDALAAHLAASGLSVRASHQDVGDAAWSSRHGVDGRFEPLPSPAPADRLVLLRLPREKARFEMVLHALAAGLDPAARLWVIGEKRAGINSAPSRLARRFERVVKLDTARHCALYEASGPLAAAAFDLDDYAEEHSIEALGQSLCLCSLPGVFAHGRIDAGTTLLLRALEPLAVTGRVLDFACGNGVIGLTLLAREPALDLTLLDTSALALEASRRSLRLNGLKAHVLASDGLAGADGAFDWIVSNPPFHRGVDNDLDIAAGFFDRAGTFLRRDGRIVVVFNRHLPYARWMRERFRSVEPLVQGRDFTVMMASEPK